MVTRSKKETALETPAVKESKKKIPAEISNADLYKQLVTLNETMTKIHDLIYSSDWKLWKTMNMIEMVSLAHGYEFTMSPANSGDDENIEVKEKEV